jgi:hypothetical protein
MGGDVLDLISRKEQIGFTGSLIRARALLDRVPADWQPEVQLEEPTQVRPSDWRDELAKLQLHAIESQEFIAGALKLPRGAGDWAVTFYHLGLDNQGAILFPYFDDKQELVGCKVRYPNGERVSLPGSRYPCLYGAWRGEVWPSWSVLIAEGETDSIWSAWALSGRNTRVFGAPGAGATPTEQMLAPLRHARLVYLGFDADGAGDSATYRWSVALTSAGIPSCRLPIPRGEDIRSSEVGIDELLANAYYSEEST